MPDDRHLIGPAKAGDHAAQEALLKMHSGAIWRTALRFKRRNPHADTDDLVQVGRLGLLRALEKFDETRPIKFLTYALYWIENRIRRECQEATLIRVPHRDMREHEYFRDVERALGMASLDEIRSGSDSARAFDLPEKAYQCPFDHEDVAILHEAIGLLPEAEHVVIRERFFSHRTLAQIGELTGRTKERIRQIETTALERIEKLIRQLRKVRTAVKRRRSTANQP